MDFRVAESQLGMADRQTFFCPFYLSVIPVVRLARTKRQKTDEEEEH